MSVFDTIKNAVSGALGSLNPTDLPALVNEHYPGGLDGMLGQLQQSGYGQQVASWLGHGPNDPLGVDDLRNALQDEHVRSIADKLGLPVDQVLDGLAEVLPAAVDADSPDGHLRTGVAGGAPAGNG